MQPMHTVNRLAHAVYGTRVDDALRSLGARRAAYRAYQRILGRLHSGDTIWLETDGHGAEFWTVHDSELLSLLHTWRKERAMIEDFLGELREDDVVWDVGANLGLYTVFADRVVDAPVQGFEPYAPSAIRATENVHLNGGDAVIDERALWNERGRAALEVERPEIGTQTPAVDAETGGFTIDRIQGDALVEAIGSPDVLKVDVEGAEDRVLEGCATLLETHVRAAYVEVHDSESPIRTALQDAGLDVERVAINGEQCCLKGTRCDD